ncbi:hypothetical protein TNCT_389931 [Trichonephila clavata]|uniref:Uncharacterized protein n=1 Tax=Trichonephila clavata TaxID=2740835 RepID=A0A8X6GGG1_TRICU|nr:hypothetical protein TNCT_389931 [Trichonephila clavata]
MDIAQAHLTSSWIGKECSNKETLTKENKLRIRLIPPSFSYTTSGEREKENEEQNLEDEREQIICHAFPQTTTFRDIFKRWGITMNRWFRFEMIFQKENLGGEEKNPTMLL